MRLLRITETLEATGETRTPLYERISNGLFTRPVKVGGRRASGWPEKEVQAILSARVAGASDDEIRRLVDRLHAQRQREYSETTRLYLREASGHGGGQP